jgi:hypothetical protein
MVDRGTLCNEASHREPDEISGGDPGVVKDRDGVIDEVIHRVGPTSEVPPGREPRIPPVESDHPVPDVDERFEEGRLPLGRLACSTGEQQHGGVAGTVDVVPQVDAIAVADA